MVTGCVAGAALGGRRPRGAVLREWKERSRGYGTPTTRPVDAHTHNIIAERSHGGSGRRPQAPRSTCRLTGGPTRAALTPAAAPSSEWQRILEKRRQIFDPG